MDSIKVKDQPLQNGLEHLKKNEEKVAMQIVKLLQNQMIRMYEKQGKRQLRQIHPKMNGCVKGEFIIEKDLPGELKVGLFKEPVSFPCWIRFSNGNTTPLPDWEKDIRGCALKIMNVPGAKIVEPEEGRGNQDFILMNTKTFVANNVRNFYQVLKLLIAPTTFFSVFSKIALGIKNAPILVRGAKAKIKCNHPFEQNYYSTVPFGFSDGNRAVKYAFIPSENNELEYTDKKNEDFLRLNMKSTLEKHEIVYDFFIQFQTDPKKMPIEDPVIDWNSPLIKMATVRIPTQIFNTPEQNEFGDNLSFNSWHALPEHRPLGSINRARKIIYGEMADFRLKYNKVTQAEPQADGNFFTNTNLKTHDQSANY
ncbi:MAG TPA: catalase family protein [Hanamia sp.]